MKVEDIADVLNAINNALEETAYEAVGYDNTGYFLQVLIDRKEGQDALQEGSV